ncbi:MAG: hypothetical protein LWX07_12690, partial [Bacteroidetes bacterium]|nr:hypothetical protein [Bacteroidota bacterium]
VNPSKDSAMKYYAVLKTDFPNSEYAKTVLSRLEFYESLNRKDTVKTTDSTGVKDTTGIKDTVKIIVDSLGIQNPGINDTTKVNPEQNTKPDKDDGSKGDKNPENKEMIKPDDSGKGLNEKK